MIDDRVAFCGGIDLTIRRWDTAEHRADDARRRDPRGIAYAPMHDVQVAVDGEAARALGDLRGCAGAATGDVCRARADRAGVNGCSAARVSGRPVAAAPTAPTSGSVAGRGARTSRRARRRHAHSAADPRSSLWEEGDADVREVLEFTLAAIAARAALHLHREPIPHLGREPATRSRSG